MFKLFNIISLLCITTNYCLYAQSTNASSTNILLRLSAYSLNTNFFDVTKLPLTITNLPISSNLVAPYSVTNSWISRGTNIVNINPGDVIVTNGLSVTNGISSFKNNGSPLTSISVTSSPFTWQNNQLFNVCVFIIGGTLTDVSVNTTSLGSAFRYVVLQRGESVVVTYSSVPTMVWKAF